MPERGRDPRLVLARVCQKRALQPEVSCTIRSFRNRGAFETGADMERMELPLISCALVLLCAAIVAVSHGWLRF